MASKKSGGTAKNLRDSGPQYLGVKLFAGETAYPGSIIVRQRGTKFVAGKNTKFGKDHTVFAIAEGKVSFKDTRKIRYDGRRSTVKTVIVA